MVQLAHNGTKLCRAIVDGVWKLARCCANVVICSLCSGGNAPQQYLVKFTGIAGSCGAGCDVFNDPAGFVLTFTVDWSGVGCFWRYDFPSTVCGSTNPPWIDLFISVTGYMDVRLAGVTTYYCANFRYTHSLPMDCLVFDNLDVPWDSDAGSICLGITGTCSVTAL